jgi:hypothetical protein
MMKRRLHSEAPGANTSGRRRNGFPRGKKSCALIALGVVALLFSVHQTLGFGSALKQYSSLSTVKKITYDAPKQDSEDDSNAKQNGNDDGNSKGAETDGNSSDSSHKIFDGNSEKPESPNDNPEKKKGDQAPFLHDDTILQTLSEPESPNNNDGSDEITYSKPESPSDDSDELIEPNKTVLLTKRPETAIATATTKVIEWRGVKDMKSFMIRSWRGNKFCETMQRRKKTHGRPTHLNITFGCQDVFSNIGSGAGKFLSAFYGVRLAASVLGDVSVQMTCPDAVKEQTSLILPWLMGSFPFRGGASHVVADQRDVVMTSSGGIRGSGSESEGGSHISKNASNRFQMPTIKEACGRYALCPIGRMLPDIRYELRRMAVALVGVPHENHPAAAFADRYLWNPKDSNDDNDLAFSDNTMQLSVPDRGEPPLIPGVVLDDVVLHFRGGDLFDSDHPGYGFMKFSAFSKCIPPNTKSIGIVTQPFDDGAQHRKGDASSEKRQRHRVVVMALVDFLQDKFPQARVTIHNGHTETIALAYARMIMANQTIGGITSFGAFPTIASFGTGYIRKPFDKGPNQFLMNPPIDQLADNIILMEEPNLLMARTVQIMFQDPTGQDLLLEWFKNDTYCNGLASVACFLPSNSTV